MFGNNSAEDNEMLSMQAQVSIWSEHEH